MPALSSTMTEGKIVSWTKSEGEKLSKGESVVVVESDKADMDVETFYDGYLAAIMVEEGGVAAVGSAIALLAESEDEISEARSQASKSSSAAAGASASSSSSGAAAAPAPAAPAAVSSSSVPSVSVSSSSISVEEISHPASQGGSRIIASPYAKKLAKEFKIDLGSIAGSGPMGRIVAKDVELAAAVATNSSASVVTKIEKAAISPSVYGGTTVPFTTMQSAVSKNMMESLAVPTFRVGYTITTDALDSLYKKVTCSSPVLIFNHGEDFQQI